VRAAGPERIGTTTGVVGGTWRATVTPSGAVVPWDGGPTLDWAVASGERWHLPAAERSRQQQLLGGVPVVETTLRVPGGHVLQRVFSVADCGGLTLVEVENQSRSPVAVAFTRRDVWTSRPIADVSVAGIDLPAGSWVTPLAHGASTRIALAHHTPTPGNLPGGLPSSTAVMRGWQRQVALDPRFDEGGAPAVPVAKLRARLLLEGPPPVKEDPVRHLLAGRELHALGAAPPSVEDVAVAVERLARTHRRAAAPPWTVDAALDAAWHLLTALGERRAAADARRVHGELPPPGPTEEPSGGVEHLAWLRRAFARDAADGAVDLLSAPLPPRWIGRNVEAHGLQVGTGTISLAVRWHGDRPALLWGSEGVARLTCSGLDRGWSTTQASGEALLASGVR
jgi:hypothetical protein